MSDAWAFSFMIVGTAWAFAWFMVRKLEMEKDLLEKGFTYEDDGR